MRKLQPIGNDAGGLPSDDVNDASREIAKKPEVHNDLPGGGVLLVRCSWQLKEKIECGYSKGKPARWWMEVGVSYALELNMLLFHGARTTGVWPSESRRDCKMTIPTSPLQKDETLYNQRHRLRNKGRK